MAVLQWARVLWWAAMCGLHKMCPKAHASRRKNPVPDRPLPQLFELPELPPLAQLPAQKKLPLPRRWSRAVAVIMCLLVCAALLPLGACGVTVKPSGQVATGISVGR